MTLEWCPVCRTLYFDADFVLESGAYTLTCHHCFLVRRVPEKVVAQYLLERSSDS